METAKQNDIPLITTMLEKGKFPQNGNIMWIDDEITKLWCNKKYDPPPSITLAEAAARLGQKEENYKTIHITKNRTVPDNLFHRTNNSYLPTLLSGIVVLKTLSYKNVSRRPANSIHVVFPVEDM